MLALVSPGHPKQKQSGFPLLQPDLKAQGLWTYLSQSPLLPRTQAGRESSCFIIHLLQSLEPSVSCARAKGNINPSHSSPKAIVAAPSTRTLAHLDLTCA